MSRTAAETIARCDGEVLMAAGTYNTPKILMLSGIGPAAHLAAMGIKTLQHELDGVGENLQDHHEVPVVAATNGHFGYYGEDKGWNALRNGLQYLLFGTGPVTSVGVEACTYMDPDGSDRPSIKLYCVPTVYLDADIKDVKRQDGVTLERLPAAAKVARHSASALSQCFRQARRGQQLPCRTR